MQNKPIIFTILDNSSIKFLTCMFRPFLGRLPLQSPPFGVTSSRRQFGRSLRGAYSRPPDAWSVTSRDAAVAPATRWAPRIVRNGIKTYNPYKWPCTWVCLALFHTYKWTYFTLISPYLLLAGAHLEDEQKSKKMEITCGDYLLTLSITSYSLLTAAECLLQPLGKLTNIYWNDNLNLNNNLRI